MKMELVNGLGVTADSEDMMNKIRERFNYWDTPFRGVPIDTGASTYSIM